MNIPQDKFDTMVSMINAQVAGDSDNPYIRGWKACLDYIVAFTGCNVRLLSVGPNWITAIKLIREHDGMDLAEAKHIVDTVRGLQDGLQTSNGKPVVFSCARRNELCIALVANGSVAELCG